MPRTRRRRHHQHWTPAGTLCVDPNAPKPEVDVVAYGAEEAFEAKLDDLKWVEDHRSKHPVLWVNVDGLGDSYVVGELGRIFNLHKLALEDVVHGNQRPKVDIYEGHLFISLRMLYRHEGRVETEQLSLFLGPDFLISFQEGIPGDCFNPLRERLRKEGTRLRGARADFLAYSLIDAVIDAYFPFLEDLGEQLEHLEDRVMTDPCREVVQEIHNVKRDLLVVRRAVWPLREAINPLLRDETPLVCHETRVFLRDAYDHCIQVVDLLETYRDLGSSLMDIYLSSISNKMNEVMKVLTIITTIFVPLTFVAGVYGMNFNTEKSPWNMPELNTYYGYPLCWLVMLTIAGVEIFYFWRKGWIWEHKRGPKPPPPQIT
ncbi:magnesium/cobalt transporter CorA [bacterium]|nr:magnesium/cobalt transporter CorA [bacterium]